MFRSSISSWQLCHPLAEWIYDTLGKEMVVISEDYAGGHDVATEIMAPYIAKGGKIIKEVYVPVTVTDYSPYLTAIRALDAKVAYRFLDRRDACRPLRAAMGGIGHQCQAHRLCRPRRRDHGRGAGEGGARRHHLDHLLRHAGDAGQPEIRRGLSRQDQGISEPVLGLRLCRDAGDRRGPQGHRRRRIEQGQARRGDGESEVRRASGAVPLRSRDAQPDPDRLFLRGAAEGRSHRQRRHRHASRTCRPRPPRTPDPSSARHAGGAVSLRAWSFLPPNS